MSSEAKQICLLFVVFFLCLCLAVLGLHCREGFSLGVASRAPLYLGCAGFSLLWLFILQRTGSGACRLSNCGSWAQWLLCMWDLSRSGILNLCLLPWPVDSLPLSQQESPSPVFKCPLCHLLAV